MYSDIFFQKKSYKFHDHTPTLLLNMNTVRLGKTRTGNRYLLPSSHPPAARNKAKQERSLRMDLITWRTANGSKTTRHAWNFRTLNKASAKVALDLYLSRTEEFCKPNLKHQN